MKRFLRAVILTILATTGSQQAVPQKPVPPPPKPADSGPSLAVTMQFLQQKLNEIGKVTFVLFTQNVTDGSTATITIMSEVSNVVADPTGCRVSFHWKTARDGAPATDQDFAFVLNSVQDIVVKPFPQYQSEVNASAGMPNIIVTSTNPTLTTLLVRRSVANYFNFPVIDVDLADRLAKAFTHAVELCGGGNKDPF
jgi:hypothetical protein